MMKRSLTIMGKAASILAASATFVSGPARGHRCDGKTSKQQQTNGENFDGRYTVLAGRCPIGAENPSRQCLAMLNAKLHLTNLRV
jgi:hypothetical protein